MRALIAGLVVALGIAETAMRATALYAERTDITPPTVGPEVHTDQDPRRGTELSGVTSLGLGARPTIEKRVVRRDPNSSRPGGSPHHAVGRSLGGRA